MQLKLLQWTWNKVSLGILALLLTGIGVAMTVAPAFTVDPHDTHQSFTTKNGDKHDYLHLRFKEPTRISGVSDPEASFSSLKAKVQNICFMPAPGDDAEIIVSFKAFYSIGPFARRSPPGRVIPTRHPTSDGVVALVRV